MSFVAIAGRDLRVGSSSKLLPSELSIEARRCAVGGSVRNKLGDVLDVFALAAVQETNDMIPAGA